MLQEDKELLLKDLCARLPYGVKLDTPDGVDTLGNVDTNEGWINASYDVDEVKPYLRPLSSMTQEECTQLSVLLPRYFIVTPEHLACLDHINGGIINFEVLDTIIDFYNSHHLDWRGLIPKGLALEAPKGMYNIKEK